MEWLRFWKKLFRGKDGVKENTESTGQMVEPVQHTSEPEPGLLPLETAAPVKPQSGADVKQTDWQGRLVLSSADLMQMARKLQSKGEYYRAEQLLRDGVQNALSNPEYWWLLYEIEDPLNRKGRAYYCLEQILQLNANDVRALEKVEELKGLIDTDLSYFIEYKLAPEFYRLK